MIGYNVNFVRVQLKTVYLHGIMEIMIRIIMCYKIVALRDMLSFWLCYL